KSLHLTRPGGFVAVLTSRYTLDARNPAARREMQALADLVGAVRFPARAFAESSGTDVVCDLVVLRRRPDGAEPGGPRWATTVPAPVDIDGEELFVNEHLAANPGFVLGTLAVDRGIYRERELTVEANGTSLTVVGANQGRMGWCGEHADRQFDSSEIPQASPGDTVSITVKKTKACAQPGEQWNTLGGSTAERFTVDLRNGPAFVDLDADGDQDWLSGSGCYAGAGGDETSALAWVYLAGDAVRARLCAVSPVPGGDWVAAS
ncbi:MAG: hypothetical protein KY450_04580, partial [Actinobacteria bacterium]|nr:hypothetical protein [Actinomycetota bacterium]